jgi:hypothetical protein
MIDIDDTILSDSGMGSSAIVYLQGRLDSIISSHLGDTYSSDSVESSTAACRSVPSHASKGHNPA